VTLAELRTDIVILAPLFTKAVEAIGLITAVSLMRRPSPLAFPQAKGTLT
jgi:hypothetical protein